jgi:hypothetical protein
LIVHDTICHPHGRSWVNGQYTKDLAGLWGELAVVFAEAKSRDRPLSKLNIARLDVLFQRKLFFAQGEHDPVVVVIMAGKVWTWGIITVRRKLGTLAKNADVSAMTYLNRKDISRRASSRM